MARRKKSSNELDAILEQLKRSYGADSDTELEDSLLEDEVSEEDAELNSILANIFSDLEIDTESSRVEAQNEQDEPMPVESVAEEIVGQTASAPDTKKEAILTVSTEPSVDELPENTQEQEPIVSSETQEVDSVLDAMLGLSNTEIAEKSNKDTEQEFIREAFSPIAEILDDEPDALQELTQDEEPIAAIEIIEDEAPAESEDAVEYEEPVATDETVQAEEPIELEESTAIDDSEIYEDEQTEEVDTDEAIQEMQEQPILPHIVLEECDYTPDPLQLSFADLQFIKPDKDIDQPDASDSIKEEAVSYTAKSESFDGENDSLLLKFGYSDELDSASGNERSKTERDGNQESFSPDKNTIIYGYYGKEYTDRSQADTIKKKYRSDRFSLLVTLIALCAFTLISFIVGLIFEFAPQKLDYYVPAMSLDFLLVSLSALVCGKRIMAGASAISRFEVNSYSTMLILGVEYLLYNVVITAIYIINPVLMHSSFSWISGSCILAYFAVVALCDLITCHKEYKTFELMADNETLYCAQKMYPSIEDDNINAFVNASNTGAYRVNKTSIVKGYFKKTSTTGIKTFSPIYVLGIVPIIALALSCCTAIIAESAVRGIHTFMIVSVLSIPLSCLCLEAVNGFVCSEKHKTKNAAFIGADSELEYSSASLLVFNDTEALEITSYKEINSAKGVEGIQNKLITAYNVFNTLGGPLGEIVPDKYVAEGGHELIINSISDNGIDIYFDSSTNILIGDRQYMQAHNLKVKTDVNLTTATKGADRSVIYMAFDGKPQLGFVLTGRILPDFSKLTAILSAYQIAILVEGYEPEVNDMYFEQNKTSDLSMLSVHKPSRFSRRIQENACDSNLIATDALSLSTAITECRNEPLRKKRIKKANLVSFIIGVALSVATAATLCIDAYVEFLNVLGQHPFISVSIASVLSAIPAIINVAKEYFRK